MNHQDRRSFLKSIAKSAGTAAALGALPPAIQRALAATPGPATSVRDIEHIVIVMLENRSFDHYFGTMEGVRGFMDRFPIPLNGSRMVWQQPSQTSPGQLVWPFRLDKSKVNALRIDKWNTGTQKLPHSYSDAQAAWNQGRMNEWTKYKTDYSMGYYTSAEIPFHHTLAAAFTLCDAYFCSVTGSTGPNRVSFWSGSNSDPNARMAGSPATKANAEITNYRSATVNFTTGPKNVGPESYVYSGTPFNWKTLPELLEAAGVSWRIFQDPKDNWEGMMHGGLAFAGFRNASMSQTGPLWTKGLQGTSTPAGTGPANYVGGLPDFCTAARAGTLPRVSWILPTKQQTEHPSSLASSARGADFLHQILDALTATSNSGKWSKTALFITYDENDGFFDHMPPPSLPSATVTRDAAGNDSWSFAGQCSPEIFASSGDSATATRLMKGEYVDLRRFNGNSASSELDQNGSPYLDATDFASNGGMRPAGLGPRVPMMVVSPWTKGGFVNSQVFSHASMGMFLEKACGIDLGANISPWTRKVCGDLTSTFNFGASNVSLPNWPDTSGYQTVETQQETMVTPTPRLNASRVDCFPVWQTRKPARAIPYFINASCKAQVLSSTQAKVTLTFSCESDSTATVFHVYDRKNLQLAPARYTVAPGRSLSHVVTVTSSDLNTDPNATYDLEVFGPNGFYRRFAANLVKTIGAGASVILDRANSRVRLDLSNFNAWSGCTFLISDLYGSTSTRVTLAAGQDVHQYVDIPLSSRGHGWYDFTMLLAEGGGYWWRLAGHMETGRDDIADPRMGDELM